jgi:CheY-like chemotaxis protein
MNEPAPAPLPVPGPESSEAAGLLLSRDPIFTSKVTGTARELGHRVLVAGTTALASAMIDQWLPQVVFVDLTAGDLASLPALTAYRRGTGSGVPFVAFGPHVDTAALESARAAGCDEVLTRSKFSADLPALIRRYFDGAGKAPGPPPA